VIDAVFGMWKALLLAKCMAAMLPNSQTPALYADDAPTASEFRSWDIAFSELIR